MGNCASGVTTTVTAGPMLQSISHSSNRALTALDSTLKEEYKVQWKTDDCAGDVLKCCKDINEEDESHQTSIGNILPCANPLAYTKKATLRPLSPRQSKVTSDVNTAKLSYHNHSYLSEHGLPGVPLSQKLSQSQSYKKETVNSIFATDDITSPDNYMVPKKECMEIAFPSTEEEESDSDGIESADKLLNDLIEIERMEKKDERRRKPRHMERPKTRRGHTDNKKGITQQSGMDGNKIASIVKEKPENHTFNDAFKSTSHKTTLETKLKSEKTLAVYDEAELRMIDEIEKEFTL